MKKLIKGENFKLNTYYFLLYSFFGWIYEIIFYRITLNKFINPGYMFGPYVPIYGIGAVLLILILQKVMKKKVKIGKIDITFLVILLVIALVTTTLEYSISYLMELIFHRRWWDYSNDWLNINGRVCFYATRNFCIGGIIFLYVFQPIFLKIYNKLSIKIKNNITLIFWIVFISDFIISTIINLVK